MQQCQVSMYGSAMDTKGKTCSLQGILSEIKKGKWKNITDHLRSIKDEDVQKEYKKKNIPCFTPSGTFQDRKVLIKHTGVIVMDFDTKDNPGLLSECSEHRQALIEDEYTYFLFSSCRGDGLAVGLKIDPDKHLNSFLHLEKYYKDKHELKADICKDVNRLRFVSYDPHLYINENSKAVQIAEESKELSSHDIVKKIIASGKLIGNDTYDEWVRIGFSLATEFGEAGRHYFHALSRASSKYDQEDCEKKYNNCIKTNRGEVAFGTLVAYAKQAGIDIRCRKFKTTDCKESEVTLKDEVMEWIKEHDGEITLMDLYRDLSLSDKADKANARKVIGRLSKEGIIKPDGKRSGCYRKIDIDCPKIDWKNADLTEVPVTYPLGLEKMIVTLRKTIIVVAGVSDAGKSVFLMQFAAMNTGKGLPVIYFSSEMGDAELKFRINKTDIPREVWDEVDFRERCINFDQVIDPNAINIIDYLEVYENPYMIGERIKEIFDRLKTGIAIIAIQKDSSKEFGWGGIGSMHKSRLYLNIDYEQLTIKKAKNKRYMETSLRDKKIKFAITRGIMEPKSDWFK